MPCDCLRWMEHSRLYGGCKRLFPFVFVTSFLLSDGWFSPRQSGESQIKQFSNHCIPFSNTPNLSPTARVKFALMRENKRPQQPENRTRSVCFCRSIFPLFLPCGSGFGFRCQKFDQRLPVSKFAVRGKFVIEFTALG